MAADRIIQWTTAGAVIGVAAIASYMHPYALARAHGEAGLAGLPVSLTTDALIYATSIAMPDPGRWEPARLGFTIPTTRRIAGPAHRTRTRYGVDVLRLMAAGLLKAGDTLVAVHRGTEHQAIVLDDGRIKLAGGEPFTSLSSAAALARGTQSANGWEFWQLQTRRERRPLREFRDELIRGER
jgi:RAMA domain-containing protein